MLVPITSHYKLYSTYIYSSPSQLHSELNLNIDGASLHAQCNDLSNLKFKGKMDVSEGDIATLSDLNLESFL